MWCGAAPSYDGDASLMVFIRGERVIGVVVAQTRSPAREINLNFQADSRRVGGSRAGVR